MTFPPTVSLPREGGGESQSGFPAPYEALTGYPPEALIVAPNPCTFAERPRFDLVVNRAVARKLGVAIAPAVVGRADLVTE